MCRCYTLYGGSLKCASVPISGQDGKSVQVLHFVGRMVKVQVLHFVGRIFKVCKCYTLWAGWLKVCKC